VISRISILAVVLLSVTSGASAQNNLANTQTDLISSDISKTVVPITSLKLVPSLKTNFLKMPSPQIGGRAAFGTGFCLDAVCRFVVTNYHVAIISSARRIKGRKIIHKYFATGKDDKSATVRFLPPDNVVMYAEKHDLALYELDKPIQGHRGLKFSLDDLQPGQRVDIYGYPFDFNPKRSLVRIPARFKAITTSDLLAFDYDPSDEKSPHVRGGSSGGIVVDRKTQRIVGVLCAGDEGETLALAVPIRNLVDFVSKVQPFVSVKTFPAFKNVSPLSVDLYPGFEPLPDFDSSFEPTHAGVLEHRPEEPDDIKLFREKAQRLADSMRNFIAVQSFSWGSGDKEPQAHAEYEVKVIGGDQKFRSYPDGKKERERPEFPLLNGWTSPSDQWAELPNMLGTEYKLKIRHAQDSEIDGNKIEVFQYRADLEDKLCGLLPLEDYILFTIGKTFYAGCHGEAWVGADGNIIRISQSLELSDKRKEYKGWEEVRIVLTYGLIEIADEPSRLAPLTILMESQHHDKRIYWCRGSFSNYRLFASHSRIVASAQGMNQMDQK